MSKEDSMAPFSPAHEPDEGYSEDPLNPPGLSDQRSALSSLRSPAELPQWLAANASLLPVSVKAKLAIALLDHLPTSVIADIVERLNPRLYIDFIRHLPAEICLKILSYLDPVSLVSVLRTSRAWYDLAVDRKLWERLYHLQGWKVIRSEMDAWELRVNAGVSSSIGRLHRIQASASDHHPNKIRAILNDDQDLEMPDHDRLPSINNNNNGASLFGSPGSSFSANRQNLPSLGDMSLGGFSLKGKEVDRGFAPTEGRAKRKEPGGTPEVSLPLMVPGDNAAPMFTSTLWAWDVASSRYRINWKYLYNMRRRLESNWELGKYTTFVLPHPNHPEEGHHECVYTLQFDSNYLVSGSRDRTMRIWNMHTRRLVRPPLTGHSGSVLCLQFDADPSEDILVSGSSDSNVFIWKFSTGELIQKITKAHRESVLNVRFDKRVLVTSSKDKTIKIFNRRPLRYGDLGYGTPDVAIDPVGISVKPYGYKPDLSQVLPVRPAFTMIGRLDGHGAAVNAIQVRGRTIVSVSGDRQIKVWNWPEQVCTQTIPAHDKGIACVEFDERRIVSGSSDYEVCIFDAPTGLKVASLRGHAHLVRTVQAGFGDLPYSKEEDEVEAKKVDAEFVKAVESGEIDHEGDWRHRRGRTVNPGSSRPADLQATGAKVPPGGGGGRKYGRIVSGSYDQSIIVWRRDKEGVWKPAHHLRQEEAAGLAHQQVALENVQRSNLQTALAGATMSTMSHQGLQQSMAAAALQDVHGRNSQSADLHMAMIDQVVPLGVSGLRQALSTHPSILIYHSYLQAAIEREPSPFIRSQLRQAVADGLIAIQNHQSARPRPVSRPAPPHTARPSSTVPYAGPSSSFGPANGSGGSGSGSSAHQPPPHPSNAGTGPSQPVSQAMYPSAAAPMQGPPPQVAVQGALPGVAGQAHQQAPAQTPDDVHAAQHHPRIAQAENAAARVFKLQFDARKIVCCTQAPVVVGWDFCNGDADLEEVVRFFATID